MKPLILGLAAVLALSACQVQKTWITGALPALPAAPVWRLNGSGGFAGPRLKFFAECCRDCGQNR